MELRSALPTALVVGVLLGFSIVGLETFSEREGGAPPISALAVAELAIVPVRWDIPVVWNESVRAFVTLFSGEQSDRMALYLKRSGRYEGMIRTKLREQGMPEDLLYLSMIESGFNPNARSRAQAVGLWQFMAGTARDYGLRVDAYVDERRDPEKSTDAALRYLQDLHKQFGSWNLAAAAYNTGQVRVSRAMRATTGADKGVETDFWRIRRLLPRDTREYVPLIYAAALVAKDPQKYGLGHVERWLPVPTDTVAVAGETTLAAVAKAVGTTEDDLLSLNPQLIKGMTPPGQPYPVRVPDGSAASLANKIGNRE
ncbi:MAG: transglycosylase SLT domain-containing protein [Gemmatimonadetes bacterium]|nr:transglycosylase SLT domain-containing protein [Gemmatimonadota bacterium]